MKLDNKFVLPVRKTKEVKVRILSNNVEDKEEMLEYIRAVSSVKGNIKRIKPDTETNVDAEVVYIKADNLVEGLYEDRFVQKALPLRQFTYLAYEGKL